MSDLKPTQLLGRFFWFWGLTVKRAVSLSLNYWLMTLLGGFALAAALFFTLPILARRIGWDEAQKETNYIIHGLWGLAASVGVLFVFFMIVAPASMYWEQRDKAGKVRDKSATLKLARELDEMIPESPWGDIHSLKKKVGRTTGAPTVEQVRDVKRRWMGFIKEVRDKLVDTAHKTEFGYEDDSNEWARIRDLDTSDVPGSLNTLERECQFFSRRLDDVTTNMRQT